LTTQTSSEAVAVRRVDYRPPDHCIDQVELEFFLDRERTRVRARLQGRRNSDTDSGRRPLVLAGEDLALVHLRLNGSDLVIGEFEVNEQGLSIPEVPDRFELETEVEIRPRANTRLSGLYLSNGIFCTQCEAEGFRRITYFPDRPDVMARYSVYVEADRDSCPVLLSNGNRVETGDLPGRRHFARYEDPFPKPSYLFALVAGNLACKRGAFTTRSGRAVDLELWVEPQNIGKCDHALLSLQRAMKWDEEVFGLEYDLDVYMIVAVNDFNMGAMENKGLNVFNSKYVLAEPATATDDDYRAIEGVIAHEYFHNWTGNRVTCRDWFQLTLKEGLTVFRDQQFSADMGSAALKRIEDVLRLRHAQFAEDGGPMSHPIRPESYRSIDNFYTATVYEKGAEVVRMLHTLLGPAGFRRGMDLYFQRHDGQAVTCDDFRAAMADACGADLAQFERWYSQAGTPTIEARGTWHREQGLYELSLRQEQLGPGGVRQEPLHVPVRLGLIGADGRDIPITLEHEPPSRAEPTRQVELREREQVFRFTGVRERPVLSLMRGFSAPVRVRIERPRKELYFLMAHDSDPFNRWDAGQELAKTVLLEQTAAVAAGSEPRLDPLFVEAFGQVLDDPLLDASTRAFALTLPGEVALGQELEVVDPAALHEARRFVVRELARALRGRWRATYLTLSSAPDGEDESAAAARRHLRNRALSYLVALEEDEFVGWALRQLREATCMTDAEAALAALVTVDRPERVQALEHFHATWKDDPLVLDKWFRLQALSPLPETFERVVELAGHPDFSLRNPNRVRALLGAFSHGNQVRFHDPSGEPYRFMADQVLAIDALNPQLAARMVSAFNQWRRFDATRREAMASELRRIGEAPELSRDTAEIVSRALAGR
jgi:aminopeptidase N